MTVSERNVRAVEGADLLLLQCGRLTRGERVTIVCDDTTAELGQLLRERAHRITSHVVLVQTPPLAMHGEEPPRQVAEAMLESDLCLGITTKSIAHTNARISAAAHGARYLSLPDYSMDLLSDESLRANYEEQAVLARHLADAFTNGSRLRVTSSAGTDVTMSIDGREGNCCPGYVSKAGDLGSPPDIESNVSPIEDSAEGTVVVDASIPYPTFGLLKAPVVLRVKGGSIVRIEGEASTTSSLEQLMKSAGSPRAYVLAECGVGLNDKARLSGVMLTDEGAAGTMHFGFGSNSTVGGKNEVSFHLDFVLKNPSLFVDGHALIERGILQHG